MLTVTGACTIKKTFALLSKGHLEAVNDETLHGVSSLVSDIELFMLGHVLDNSAGGPP